MTQRRDYRHRKKQARTSLQQIDAPGDHLAILVRHHAMKGLWLRRADHRQEEPVALPHRQFREPIDRHPFERTFVVAGVRGPGPTLDTEDKAEPSLAVLAESWP